MQGQGVGYVADGAVAVSGSLIVGAGPTKELRQRFVAHETIDAANCAVLPGFIDAHMHTPLAIVRGVAQDVDHWMQKALAPYTRHLTAEAMLAGTRLNILEGLRSGTTTFSDYYDPVPGWAEAFAEFGVRACLTPLINSLPSGGMAGWRVGELYPLDEAKGQRMIEAAAAFVRAWQNAANGRITTMLGPQGADMASADQLRQIKDLAQREGVMIHLHLAQGDREIEQMLKRYGRRTPAFLDELGYLDEQLLGVHLTEATDEEAQMLARKGVRMALCSGSIGIIDGIVPPARPFKEAGGLVCLGSDQASGNNCNNIFNEMKLTALFNKIKYRDPTVLPAWEVLRMATIEGAQAIGLGHEIGSLAAGKKADLIIIDLTEPNLLPVLDEPIRTIVPNLVYAGTGREVRTVMVDGQILLRDGVVQTVDDQTIREQAQLEAQKVARRVAADPLHRELALLIPMAQEKL
jgi:5-methylthioadenosine/S-adenosylhomocysteine deaminase